MTEVEVPPEGIARASRPRRPRRCPGRTGRSAKSTGRSRCCGRRAPSGCSTSPAGSAGTRSSWASRGFDVVGIDISEELLEIARREAEAQSLDVSFVQADLRELALEDDFDLVLSLNDGAIGYFETDEENYRTFEVVAQALRSGGGHLMQLPNVLHAEKHLPQRNWLAGETTLELSDHRWNAKKRYLEGFTVPIRFGEVLEGVEPIPFRQRLYSVEELTDLYDSVGMRLANVFRGSGKPRMPRDNQYEIFVEGRKA